MLHEHHKQFLTKLFPTHDFIKYPVKFPTVQSQPNGSDCGIFAIAFAVSLLFNIKPEKVRYDHSLMRLHLIKIFETNIIEHFPQDLNYDVPQKVLPLAVVRARQVEAARIRIKRQYEKEYDILNQVKEAQNSQQCMHNLEKNHAKRNKQRRRYEQELENNRAEQRRRYEQNLENNRAKQRHRYEQDLENNRAKQRRRYEQKLENNLAEKRRRYEQNLENNCAEKWRRYDKNLIKERAQKRKRYFINSERERERQKELSSDRKWLYNKRYYQKRKSNSILENKNKNHVTENICKKYVKIRVRNFIKIRDSPEVFVKNILDKLNITDCSKGYIEK
ncbi:eukaryotic translation initiation factor 3 subunit A-like [Ooceraea biroi]|uniref:eukaryotic translation initiation factor 3 subunit A-like n=1 Tax=Ooceraea biroi TaxID=2015173 RepID=UPI000F097C3A|nr:eukaryotic translation initiation factor 3 subunit A-like [Ooceraea biroi]